MSGFDELTDKATSAARHEVVTGLQILTLTAELLAFDLRDGNRTGKQVLLRSQALRTAVRRVTEAARRIPAQQIEGDGATGSFSQSEAMREIRVYVGFIAHHAEDPDVERDILAEYVDALHDHSAALIQSIDGSNPD